MTIPVTISLLILQPQLDDSMVLDLGQPRYRVTYLQQNEAGAANACSSRTGSHEGASTLTEIVSLAAAFKRVAEQASGHSAEPPSTSARESGGHEEGATLSSVCMDDKRYGPWRPFPAPVLANERITSSDHFQDTR